MKYRVLLFVPHLEKPGGVADYCKMLVSHLGSNFRVTHFIVGGKSGSERVAQRLVTAGRGMIRLIRILIKREFDVIQMNPSFKSLSLARDTFFLLLITLFGHGRKTVVLFHGWDQRLAEKAKKSAVRRTILSSLYRRVGMIMVLFGHCRKQFLELGVDSDKVITTTTMYEGTDSDDEEKIISERRRSEVVNLLFMSRLIKEKGVYIAAEVARLLAQNGRKDFCLTFAGDGPEFRCLRSFISEKKLEKSVIAAGFVSGAKKESLLRKSDIFLFPTYYGEGCPVVVLEAMGAGLAIVSTPIGAIPEVVIENENGFIIDSRDPKDFVEAITRLMDDRELLKRIQETNRKKAAENYEAKVITRKIEAVYSRVAHG